MGRSARIQAVGVPLHVTQRGHWRQAIFKDAIDYRIYLDSLKASVAKVPVSLHAFCLMGNHVHLLVTPYSGLAASRFMQSLNTRFSQRINSRWSRSGTVWEGRYRSRPVGSDKDFFACMRYIDNNPVQAGIVQSAVEYEWSSHRHYAGVNELEWIKEHSLYRELGCDKSARYCAYWGMF